MRPEELIADIYRQVRERRAEGGEPVQVVMSIEHCRLLQWYKNLVGETEGGSLDYLGEYEIFGLEILIEQRSRPLVQ